MDMGHSSVPKEGNTHMGTGNSRQVQVETGSSSEVPLASALTGRLKPMTRLILVSCAFERAKYTDEFAI